MKAVVKRCALLISEKTCLRSNGEKIRIEATNRTAKTSDNNKDDRRGVK